MQTPFVGQVVLYAFKFAPPGWAPCEGQILPISQYTALFSLLGLSYGGDGKTTFGLPDYRGLAPEGMQYCIALQGLYPGSPPTSPPRAGEVALLPYFQRIPEGWNTCDGRLMPVSEFANLFQVLGTRFGGDGQTTFGLPNLTNTPPPGVDDFSSLYFIFVFGNTGSPSALLATVQLLPFESAPTGWSTCEGQLLPVNQNPGLFALLGTTFGGNGQTTFGLPDLRNVTVPAGMQYCICVSTQIPVSAQGTEEAEEGELSPQDETSSPAQEAY
jgi:microcystin-dependent protein